MTQVPTFCGKDCGGNACPLLATVDNGRVTRVTNNPAGGKYLKGCTKGFDLPLSQYAPDRILTPLVRTGPRGSGQFRVATWEDALQMTVQGLGAVREKYGATAVMDLSSGGCTSALHATSPLLARFLNLFGGRTRLESNYSNAAAKFVLPYLLGPDYRRAGFDAATMKYAEMIVLWGANILDTRMGTEIPQRLVEAKHRGAEIIVIDPRRTSTVKQMATRWIPCRPGTDAALMLAVLHTILAEGLANRAFIDVHSTGFGQLEEYIFREGLTPGWAETVCGTPAEDILWFARAYAAAKPAMLLPGYSIQRVFAGEEPYRLAVALQLATGNFGKLGGSTGALNNRLPTPRVGTMPVPWVDDLPSVPVLRWPDAVLQGREGGYPSDIHAIYSVGGNFINQGSDIHESQAAFEKVDFAVCHELFMTPTARYCDVIFPAASPLEKDDIGIPWLGNYLLYKRQIVSPLGQARSDYDIFCDLASRLGFLAEFSEGRSASEWIDRFISESEIENVEEFRQTGIYLAPDQERTGLAEFAIDPCHHPLDTPSGKVEIASERYAQDTGFSAFPTWQAPPADSRYPLRMVTPKSAHRVHSQGSNIPSIARKARHALVLNSRDAAERRLVSGDTARVFNDQGATRVLVSVSDEIMPGVVSLPEGMWFLPGADGIDEAGSVNLLTSTIGTQPAIACIMHGVCVEVSRE